MNRENTPASVPETGKQAGEAPWQRHGAERGVWTESMLNALERGVKGNVAMDKWVRMRLRSILRKRRKGKGRGRGWDHRKWPNRYFEEHGLFSLERACVEKLSLRQGATG